MDLLPELVHFLRHARHGLHQRSNQHPFFVTSYVLRFTCRQANDIASNHPGNFQHSVSDSDDVFQNLRLKDIPCDAFHADHHKISPAEDPFNLSRCDDVRVVLRKIVVGVHHDPKVSDLSSKKRRQANSGQDHANPMVNNEGEVIA